MIANAPIFFASIMALLLFLAACEGPRVDTAPPMQFMGASTTLVSEDMVDVSVSVARPIEGAMQAYADCVGSQYALIRGMPYARRVTAERNGLGDVLTDKVTYLISPIAPGGDFVLKANEVVAKCKRGRVPTF